MIEYIVFFSLLAAGIIPYIAYLMHRDPALVPTTPIKSEYSKCESPIERMLYNALTLNGYQVFTQYKVGPYRGDLFISPNLIIECDGKDYHSKPEQKAHDRRRDAYLKANGFKVLRFPGKRIYKDMPGILRRIEKVKGG